jgi:MFS family permease
MQRKISQNNIILAISFSQFVMPFMFSSVGITLPSLGRELAANAIQLGLIESIYLGAAAAVLLPFGKLADLTDKRTIFKAGLILYMCMTLLLGVTTQINFFITLRLIQGVAGGMLLATNMAILSELVPKESLGKAIGLAVGAVYLGLTTGPFIGGIITTHLHWRYVYYLGGILNAAVVIISMINIPSTTKFKFVKIDIIGSILIMSSIALLVGGSASLTKGGFGHYLLGAGVLAMILFLYSQTKIKNHLLNLKLITSNPKLKNALTVQLINYAGTFGITFLFSLYLQTIKDMTPQEAGMVLMISPVIMAIFAPIFGRLSDKISPEKIALIGMCFCFMATIIASTVSAKTPLWIIYIQFASMGLGFAMFSSPNTNIIMSSVENKFLSIASAIVAKLRSLGMVLSLTIISIFLSTHIGHHELNSENAEAYLKAMQFSLLSFVILMAIGVVISIISLKKDK